MLQYSQIPVVFCSSNVAYNSPLSSCHDITCTKSATKEGIEHFNTAALPLMTYSLFTSDS